MLVGRSSESARIDRLLNEVRGGAGGALVVLGEPGIGKSALLQYAERQAADMKRLSILGVAAEAALPYAGLNELVRPVLWGLQALPARQSRAIRLALGVGGDGTTDALAVYAGVLALLAEVASREPLIIIVDDAHWLDIETVNALAFVARRIEDESIGILLGARSSEPFEMHGVPQLRLGGVDLAAAAALVGRAGYDVAPEVVRALCEVVAGNPLALLELPGVLDADQRAGRRPLDDQLTVTASVERAFLTRIERLDAEGRWALLLAAASDSEDAETIRRAAPEAAAGLEQAERIGLVRVQRDRIGFWHPLVRSAVYTAATDEQRRAAHRALAAGLVGGASRPAGLASCRGRGGTGRRRLGRPCRCRSSRRAAAARAPARPGCLNGPPPSPRARSCGPGGCCSPGRLPGLPGSCARRTRSLIAVRRSPKTRNWPAMSWWPAGGSRPRLPARSHCSGRWSLVPSELAASHPRKAAMMLAVAWDWAWSSLDIDGARELADRAEELVPAGFGADDREVLTALAWQRLADCRVPEALRAARSAIAASAGQADLQVAYACEVLSAADQLDEAQSALAGSIAELTRMGHMPALCYSLRTRATIELRQGRMLQALKTAGEALALAQEGRASWPGWALAQVAAVEAAFGLEERCREHVLRAEQSCGGNDRWAAAEAQAALGLLELGAGEDGAALSALDEADRLLRPLRHPGFVRYAADRIETLVRLGDAAAAEAALAELEQRTTAAQSPWGRHAVARARVLVAPAELLDAAYEQVPAAPIHSGFEVARTRLVYGERLRRAGRRTEAREHLRGALGIFHAIGAGAMGAARGDRVARQRRPAAQTRRVRARRADPPGTPGRARGGRWRDQSRGGGQVVPEPQDDRGAPLTRLPEARRPHAHRTVSPYLAAPRDGLLARAGSHAQHRPVHRPRHRTGEAAGPGDKHRAVSLAPPNQEVAAAIKSNGGRHGESRRRRCACHVRRAQRSPALRI